MTQLTPTQRFQPYEASYAGESRHWNTEAGPSTPIPPFIPYAGLSALQPTEGLTPEPTADAGTEQTTTEGNEVPVSSFYCSRVPHAIE